MIFEQIWRQNQFLKFNLKLQYFFLFFVVGMSMHGIIFCTDVYACETVESSEENELSLLVRLLQLMLSYKK